MKAQASLAVAALGGCDDHHESAFTIISLRWRKSRSRATPSYVGFVMSGPRHWPTLTREDC